MSLLLPSSSAFPIAKAPSFNPTHVRKDTSSFISLSRSSPNSRFKPFLVKRRVFSDDPSSEFNEKLLEWENFVDFVGKFEEEEDLFVEKEINLEFVEHARACLLFARMRPEIIRTLPREEIKVIVENLSPSLFKNTENSVRRMKAFVEKNESNALEEQAYTVDLMKYLLSYVYDSHIRAGVKGQKTVVESSVRRLLLELTKADCTKEELPGRKLTGREWECPQCEFFNHHKNSSCLRCDFPRPKNEISKSSVSPPRTEEPGKTTESEISRRLDRILGRISSQTAESMSSKDSDSSSSEESSDGSPDLMPARKGENRFVVSKKKDRSLTSPQYKRQIAMDQATSSSFVPFVPFPPGYFARKEDPKKADDDNDVVRDGNNDDDDNDNDRTRELEGGSLEGSGVKEYDPLDMSEEAKAQRWFRRVAQITDIEELSKIPDEDFPEIMPMRKGVNRFVVSKRKTPLERRLSSQQRVGLPRKRSTSGDTSSDEEQQKFL